MSTDQVEPVVRYTSNIFKKKVAFDVLYDDDDEIDGVKTNARIDVPEFSIGGFSSRLYLKKNKEFYPLALMMDSNAPPTLADGWTSNLGVTVASSLGWETETDYENPSTITLFKFDSDVTSFELNFTLELEDVFPHRLRFKSATASNRSDCKIILTGDEDKPVYVNKNVLAVGSSYFNTLFFGDFKEKDQEAVKLDDVTEIEFLEYLYCVYSPTRPFAFKRLETLLRLADRYQNDGMMWAIEKFLHEKIDKTSEEKRLTLCLAGSYNMTKIFEDTLKTMDKTELKGLGEFYLNFNHESSTMLINRLCDLRIL